MKKSILFLLFITVTCFAQSDLNKHTVNSIAWFQQSAEAKLCYLQTYNYAKIKLSEKIKNHKDSIQIDVKLSKKIAVVLDIDETVLDNSPYQTKLVKEDKQYNFANWKNWTDLSEAKALPGAIDFVKFAIQKGVEVFYISNRDTSEVQSTFVNLKKEGFPNIDENHILLRSNSSDKSQRREIIAKNYEILLFLGDNLTDFKELYANRKNNGKELIDENQNDLLENFIMFPNPMYGEWEKALYNNKYNQTDSAKIKLKLEKIQSY